MKMHLQEKFEKNKRIFFENEFLTFDLGQKKIKKYTKNLKKI